MSHSSTTGFRHRGVVSESIAAHNPTDSALPNDSRLMDKPSFFVRYYFQASWHFVSQGNDSHRALSMCSAFHLWKLPVAPTLQHRNPITIYSTYSLYFSSIKATNTLAQSGGTELHGGHNVYKFLCSVIT